MTLCSFGRSVVVLTLVRGLTTVSIIPAAPPDLPRPDRTIQPPVGQRNRRAVPGLLKLRQPAANLKVKDNPCSRFSAAVLHVTIPTRMTGGRLMRWCVWIAAVL